MSNSDDNLKLSGGRLTKYFLDHCPRNRAVFPDGAFKNAGHFPFSVIETEGAVLFADLPGFSRTSRRLAPAEAAYYVSHFFAWAEASVGRRYGGMVDKFIGDAVMMVFPVTQCKLPPLEAAMRTARDILEEDAFGFDPKFGIAAGPFAVGLVGTEKEHFVSAMGHTINVAARCVQAAVSAKSVTVATDDVATVRAVFGSKVWGVSSVREFAPKNMEPLKVIDAVRRTMRILNFDYEDSIRTDVVWARSQQAITADPPKSEAGSSSAEAPKMSD